MILQHPQASHLELNPIASGEPWSKAARLLEERTPTHDATPDEIAREELDITASVGDQLGEGVVVVAGGCP